MRVATIVGARPQFIKAATLSREFASRQDARGGESIEEILIHTGQHFDANMSDIFFEQMELPRPHHHLGVAGGPHGQMTGRMLERIEGVLLEIQPDWVVVFGDTNSTLVGALAAAKLDLPVAHVEAGLRSFNRRMPEEINRVVTDHVASLLFAPTAAAVKNLRREGIGADRIAQVGDIMYDTMVFFRGRLRRGKGALGSLGLEPKRFVLATVHRAENTDDERRLRLIMDGLNRVAQRLPVVLPLHPRTRLALARIGYDPTADGRLKLVEPVGYPAMVELEEAAVVIVTDSGGMQKEAYFNAVPCLTLRDETEWIELVEEGANLLVGADPQAILEGFERARTTKIRIADHYGDGRAARAIVDRLLTESTSTTPRESSLRVAQIETEPQQAQRVSGATAAPDAGASASR